MEDAITDAAVGSNLGSAAPWGGSSSQIKVASGSLTSAGLLALDPPGNMASIAGTGGGSSYRPFVSTPVSSGAVYYSCLAQCTSLPTTGDKYLTGLLAGGTTSPGGSSDPLAVYAKVSGDGYQMAIRKSGLSTTYAPAVLALNTTYLIVVKYVFGSGAGDDSVSLYLNPTPVVTEPASPDVTLTGGTDAANLQNVYLKSSSGYGTWNFDTLRVGPAWADVTPSSTPSPPSQPVITQVMIDRNGLVLSGTNGTPNAAYQVIGSTSLDLPLGHWFALASNTFDASGNFACTNPVYIMGASGHFRISND